MFTEARPLPVDEEVRRQFGIRSRVKFTKSGEVSIPMTFGILKPVVLVPDEFEQWPEDLGRAVCQHELAHVRRKDYLAQFITRLACVLFWPNPRRSLECR